MVGLADWDTLRKEKKRLFKMFKAKKFFKLPAESAIVPAAEEGAVGTD
jgi:hypothetical protein